MLIGSCQIRLESPPCHPGCDHWSAFATPDADLSAVLPYLNARLPGALYDHNARALTWTMDGRAVCIRPNELAISNLADRAEAEVIMQSLIDRVNQVWEERASIEPSYTKRQPPQALALYRLLPRKNCGACDVPTCMAFAARLAGGQARPDDCPLLAEAEWAANRTGLLAVLATAGLGGGVER